MAGQDHEHHQATLSSPPFLLLHHIGSGAADNTISSSSSSFPILIISIVGMLTTALLLLSYYIFVTKCCCLSSSSSSSWRLPDVLLCLFPPSSPTTSDDDGRLRRLGYSYNSTAINIGGLDKSVFRALPTLRFRNGDWLLSGNSRRQYCSCCAVCQNEFEEENIMRMLPSCYHVFHIDCIDTWLQTHSNCPLCRADLTTTIGQYPNFRSSSYSGTDQLRVVIIDDPSVDIGSSSSRISADQAETESSVNDLQVTSSHEKKKKYRVGTSVGDECIDELREKDKEQQQPSLRRSFSMDSSGDRQLYMAVQEILQQNPHFQRPEGRPEGSFFSFSRGGTREVVN